MDLRFKDDNAAYIWNIKDISEWLDDEEIKEKTHSLNRHAPLLHQVNSALH